MVVEEEMLQTACHSVFLCGNDIWHSHLTGQVRVFAHILEATTVEWAAGDGGARAEHDVLAAEGKLLAHVMSINRREVAVPCGSQAGERREGHDGVVVPVGVAP